MSAAVGWPFRLERYVQHEGGRCVFYPSIYSRGYRLDPEQEARLSRALEPFLSRRLRIELVALIFALTMVVSAAVLAIPLDILIATPPLVLVAAAFALAGLAVLAIVVRIRRKFAGLLADVGAEASVPPRPDFFIVDGAFSAARLSYVLFVFGALLAALGAAGPAVDMPVAVPTFVFVAAALLLIYDRASRAS